MRRANLTIERSSNGTGVVTLSLAGKFGGGCLGELRREIEGARRMDQEVVIDLSEVTLVDRPCLDFLAGRQDITVVNCPPYIQPWICRGTA